MKTIAVRAARRRPPIEATIRPRARDIARAAGVSTATVDRVLNRRLGVRAATAQRVVEAAAALDYLPRAALYEALRPKPMRLAFLLPTGSNRYLRMLGEHISASDEQLSAFNVTSHCHFVEGFNPEALARSLRHHARRADGIAFMALDHPLVREAVAEIDGAGIPVLTMISDIPETPRTAYVGLDNRAAGRTAAPADRPLCRRAARQGRADRRQPQLPRPRGARDRLPRHHPGRRFRR